MIQSPPFDFEKILLIGFNENLFDQIDIAPKILASYENPDPKKFREKSTIQI